MSPLRTLLLTTLVATGGCWYDLPVREDDPSFALQDSPYTDLIASAETLHLTGTALIRPGNYRVGDDEDRIGVKIRRPTVLSFDVTVHPTTTLQGGATSVTLDVTDSVLSVDHPVVASARLGGIPVRATLDRVSAKNEDGAAEDTLLELRTELARSLGQTLTGLVLLGEGEHLQGLELNELVEALTVSEMKLDLRAGARIRYAEADLVLDDGSFALLTDGLFEPENELMEARVDLSLGVRDGSCVEGAGTKVCATTGRIDLEAEYGQVAGAHELALTSPASLSLSGGHLTRTDGTEASLESLELGLSTLQATDAGVLSLAGGGSLETGAGKLSVQGADVAYASLDLHRFDVVHGQEESLTTGPMTLTAPDLCWNCDGDRPVRVSARLIEFPPLMATDDLVLATTDRTLKATALELSADLGKARVAASADPETPLALHFTGDTILGGDEVSPFHCDTQWSQFALDASGSSYTSSDTAIALRVEAAKVPTLRAEIRSTGVLTGAQDVALSLDDLVIEVSEDQLVVDAGDVEARIPTDRVLSMIREGLPAVHSEEPQRITNDLQKAAAALIGVVKGDITDLVRYKEWHHIIEVFGLRDVHLALGDNEVFLGGRIRVAVRIRANKQHIKTDTCYKRVFGVKIPYPCIKTWHSVVDVAVLPFNVDFTGKVTTTFNTPTTLDKLQLKARPNFASANVRGVQNDIEKIALKSTYEKLQSKDISVSLGDALGDALGPLASKLELTSLDFAVEGPNVVIRTSGSVASP